MRLKDEERGCNSKEIDRGREREAKIENERERKTEALVAIERWKETDTVREKASESLK